MEVSLLEKVLASLARLPVAEITSGEKVTCLTSLILFIGTLLDLFMLSID